MVAVGKLLLLDDKFLPFDGCRAIDFGLISNSVELRRSKKFYSEAYLEFNVFFFLTNYTANLILVLKKGLADDSGFKKKKKKICDSCESEIMNHLPFKHTIVYDN